MVQYDQILALTYSTIEGILCYFFLKEINLRETSLKENSHRETASRKPPAINTPKGFWGFLMGYLVMGQLWNGWLFHVDSGIVKSLTMGIFFLFFCSPLWGEHWSDNLLGKLLVVVVPQLSNAFLTPLSNMLLQELIKNFRLTSQSTLALDCVRLVGELVLTGVTLWFFSKRVPTGLVQFDRSIGMMLLPMLLLLVMMSGIRSTGYMNTVTIRIENGREYLDVLYGNMGMMLLFGAGYLCLYGEIEGIGRLVKYMELEETRLRLEEAVHHQQNYIQESKKRERQTRSFRHDIQNHLLVVRGLLDAQKWEQAKGYLEGVGSAAEELSWQAQTGNDVLDVLLNSKLEIARGCGIRVECSMVVPPQSGVADLDFCIIMGNALDNAIKGAEESGIDCKYIRIKTKLEGNFFLIIVENTASHHAGTKPYGTGLCNIKRTVEKYGGVLQTEEKDGIYCLSVLFFLPTDISEHGQSI